MSSQGEMDALRLQVLLLAAALDIHDVPAENVVPDEVLTLARGGDRLPAVKLLRKRRHISLVQAKRIVDAISDVDPLAPSSRAV